MGYSVNVKPEIYVKKCDESIGEEAARKIIARLRIKTHYLEALSPDN